MEDASGGVEYEYDALGAVEKEIRTMIINLTNISTFVSTTQFDTWNRIQEMVYADTEKVDYSYDVDGKLHRMSGEKEGLKYQYVNKVGYDHFGDRIYLEYGNGTSNSYHFEESRRRLSSVVGKSKIGAFMDHSYEYDAMSNLTSFNNSMPVESFAIGGGADCTYTYDELYRLVSADGKWRGKNAERNFTLQMDYNNVHGISNKSQEVFFNSQEVEEKTLVWNYGYEDRHAPKEIADRQFIYDENGNLLSQESSTTFDNRQIIWDEEDRVIGISDNGYISQYTYDASGNRAIKSHGGIQGIFMNGLAAGAINHQANYTAYVNRYLTIRENRFTKHYFIDNQRILTKIGTGKFNHNLLPTYKGLFAGNLDYQDRLEHLGQTLNEYYLALGIPPGPPTLPGYYAQPEMTGSPLPNTKETNPFTAAPADWPLPIGPPDTLGPPGAPIWIAVEDTMLAKPGYGFAEGEIFPEINLFYYHNDQIGNAAYLTNHAGELRQHVSYLPFGDPYVMENLDNESIPYLFTGKEWDEETGLFYFGDRFYDPKSSLWQSADPEAIAYPAISPYAYVANNPTGYVDPDGRKIVIASKSSAFKKDVRSALQYIQNSPNGKELLNKVRGLSQVVRIRKGSDLNDVEFDPSTFTVYWHPRSGLKFDRGKKQTPALGLAHELNHGLDRAIDPKRESQNFNTKIADYHNLSEFEVISGYETSIALDLNEDTREHHGGKTFRTKGPTSTAKAKKRRKGRTRMSPSRSRQNTKRMKFKL